MNRRRWRPGSGRIGAPVAWLTLVLCVAVSVPALPTQANAAIHGGSARSSPAVSPGGPVGSAPAVPAGRTGNVPVSLALDGVHATLYVAYVWDGTVAIIDAAHCTAVDPCRHPRLTFPVASTVGPLAVDDSTHT